MDIPATSDNIPGTLVLRDNTGGFTLKPDSIVNADVSAAAAISGTKISPTFGAQNIVVTGAGNVVIGKTSANARLNIAAPDNVTTTYPLRVDNLADNYGAGFGAYGMSNRVNDLNLGIDYTIDIGDDLFIRTGGSEKVRITDGGEVGIGVTPNVNAILHLGGTTKGFLPPVLTTTQRDAITNPPAGLMIYNTTTNKLNVRTATSWEAVTSA